MQIQVNSDSSIVMDAALSERVESNVRGDLERFAAQITRVELHLSDANAEKSGAKDKRCVLEARVIHRNPVVVTAESSDVETAVRDASQKMDRLLDSLFGRLEGK